MPLEAPAVLVPSFLECLHHGLLVDDQVCDHLLHATQPLLELLVLPGHSFVLERQIFSLDYIIKG